MKLVKNYKKSLEYTIQKKYDDYQISMNDLDFAAIVLPAKKQQF